MNVTNRIYDCLATVLEITMQHTPLNKITYGFITIGEKFHRYVFNNNLNIKGCLLEDIDLDEESFINHEVINKYNITSLMQHYCNSSSLEILDLVQNKVFETTYLAQSIILNGHKIIVKNGIATIFGDNYTLSDNVFSINNITSFFGFDGANCDRTKILSFLQEHIIRKVLNNIDEETIRLHNNLHNDNLTDQYINHLIKVDNTPNDVMNVIIGFLAGMISLAIPYITYKIYESRHTSNNDYNFNTQDNIDAIEMAGLTKQLENEG